MESGRITLTGLAPTAKGSQKEVVSFLITQDHMAFLPAAPGGVLLTALWPKSV
jgi:hypothetical protein